MKKLLNSEDCGPQQAVIETLITNGGIMERHISPSTAPSIESIPYNLSTPYFWGPSYNEDFSFAIHDGYAECRDLIGDGSLKTMDKLTDTALEYISRAFKE